MRMMIQDIEVENGRFPTRKLPREIWCERRILTRKKDYKYTKSYSILKVNNF